MCSWQLEMATFRPLECRRKTQYEINKIWSHISKSWDQEPFITVCSGCLVSVKAIMVRPGYM